MSPREECARDALSEFVDECDTRVMSVIELIQSVVDPEQERLISLRAPRTNMTTSHSLTHDASYCSRPSGSVSYS